MLTRICCNPKRCSQGYLAMKKEHMPLQWLAALSA